MGPEAWRALRFGPYTLHPTQGLRRGHEEVRVTQKSLRVLWLLAERAGETVTKEELFEGVWSGIAVSDAALTSCIQELRRALNDSATEPRFIETRHRRGFRFLPTIAPVLTVHDSRSPEMADSSAVCVGRRNELEVLASAVANARAGARQLVVIRGEAGIGKTTLIDRLVAVLTGDGSVTVAGATCDETTGGSEPYRPLLDIVSRLCRLSTGDRDATLLRQYAPTWWWQFPVFHSGAAPPATIPASGVTTTRMSRELTDYLEVLATTRTLVLWLDDVQWADDGTVDWLTSFMVRSEPARVALIVALRDERPTRAHAVFTRLQARPSCHRLALGGLDESATRELVSRLHGDGLDAAELAARLYAQTEGHPLFISALLEELSTNRPPAAQTDTGASRRESGPSRARLPEALRDVIDAHIDRLDPDESDLLEVASLLTGIEWPSALVAAGSDRPVLDVEDALVRLARRRVFIRHVGSIHWPDGTASETFAFRHALHRDAFRERMPAHRRTTVHGRIGARLEQAFGPQASEVMLSLALHFEQAGQTERAIPYLMELAAASNRLGAAEDASRHLARALSVLHTTPRSSARDGREAELLMRLGGTLMAARGWGAPEVERSYQRAHALCERLESNQHRFAVLWGLWLFRWGRGELFAAEALVNELQRLGDRSSDPMLQLQVHHAWWATAFCLGRFDEAIRHADAGWAASRRDIEGEATLAYGNHHSGVCARAFAARALAITGQHEAARTAADEAVAQARSFAHPFTMALALVFASATHQTLRAEEMSRRFAEEAEAVSLEHGFQLLLAWAAALRGWTLQRANAEEAVRIVGEAVSSAAATGSGQFQTLLLGLLAETQLGAGLLDEGVATIDRALTTAQTTGERFHESELYRLRDQLIAARRAGACSP